MAQQNGRRLTLTVTSEWDGEKIDTLLRRELGLSGTVIKRIKWLEDGILLDGVRAITGQRAAAGQVLSVRVDDPDRPEVVLPTPGPVDVVYEDQDLLVVNKAPGVPVHPGPGNGRETLCNYIAYYYQQKGETAGVHPVHRLDRGTSGLMVIAKHPLAQERLKEQLHTAAFRRIYLAVCDGVPAPEQGRVEVPIGRVPGSLIQRQVDPAGQPAATRYRMVERTGNRALVELDLETGRTHQIRVHMVWLGCPLTGDFLYGREDKGLIARPALHSSELFLTHPINGVHLRLTCPLPEDMAALLR
ncbi:MAG: RluA family pseudouridine synthase [Clostridiales bacterium]|uniref:RluA family pseudouridine synthase n=1 Tax=Flavonifractor porci TaxID=3133422 RepID=UPI0030A21BA7|nr:RluA family pseudouridine synthase [Clostridiales bacterium]